MAYLRDMRRRGRRRRGLRLRGKGAEKTGLMLIGGPSGAFDVSAACEIHAQLNHITMKATL